MPTPKAKDLFVFVVLAANTVASVAPIRKDVVLTALPEPHNSTADQAEGDVGKTYLCGTNDCEILTRVVCKVSIHEVTPVIREWMPTLILFLSPLSIVVG